MKLVIVILGIVGCIQAISYADLLEEEWFNYKFEYEKSYENEDEELLRKLIFYDHKRMIDRHNKRYAAGEETYELGVNQFTDMLPKEFENMMLSSPNITDATLDLDTIDCAMEKAPESCDWRTKGAVTPVKNQGKCGSCWAFAAVGTLEGQHFLKTGKLTSLSEQNLMDCSSKKPYNNNGCNGGLPQNALKYVIDNGGIDTEDSYKYEGKQKNCRFIKSTIGATVKGIFKVAPNEKALASCVAKHGPISVGIHASLHFMAYRGGVLNDPNCNYAPNHGVVIVGYGRDPKAGDYWLVKNSYGNTYGENGYIRMSRNKNNQCRIANNAIFPLV